MDRVAALEEKYRGFGKPGIRELLLTQADALHFIEDCQRQGLVILGMDFFQDAGSQVIPLMSSADYSSLANLPDAVEQSYEEARALLATGLPSPASWVSFVIVDRRNESA
jgi:hypothetical protein